MNKKERRQLRRQEKQARRERQARRKKANKTAKKILIVGTILVVVFVIWQWSQNIGPKTPDQSQAFEIQGRGHIPDGNIIDNYNSNPPTSGPHHATPAKVRFYKQELPDEQLVHNLEHGQIWLSYQSDLSDEVKNELKKLAGGFVIVTPREKNDTDIAVAAWGRLYKFNLESDGLTKAVLDRIKDFIKRYENQGPEKASPNLPL